MIERDLVAEEERLVGGHRLDHVVRKPAVAVLDLQHEIRNAAEARPAGERQQAALDKILLVGRQIETGALLQELAQELVVERRHARSPANSRLTFEAIWLSGRI